jgi:hypothetical protein
MEDKYNVYNIIVEKILTSCMLANFQDLLALPKALQEKLLSMCDYQNKISITPFAKKNHTKKRDNKKECKASSHILIMPVK